MVSVLEFVQGPIWRDPAGQCEDESEACEDGNASQELLRYAYACATSWNWLPQKCVLRWHGRRAKMRVTGCLAQEAFSVRAEGVDEDPYGSRR